MIEGFGWLKDGLWFGGFALLGIVISRVLRWIWPIEGDDHEKW